MATISIEHLKENVKKTVTKISNIIVVAVVLIGISSSRAAKSGRDILL